MRGQLGDGTFGFRNFRLVPTKVLGGTAASGHACAVTERSAGPGQLTRRVFRFMKSIRMNWPSVMVLVK